MKKIGLLGSTGSIGTQTLDVIDRLPDEFSVTYLTAHHNSDLLIQQAEKYHPEYICISKEENLPSIRERLKNSKIHIYGGRDSLLDMASNDEVDLVMNGLVGGAGMEPTIKAISAGLDVALSNKESMA